MSVQSASGVIDFGKTPSVIEVPDLLDMLRRSYEAFVQRDRTPEQRTDSGLEGVFRESFPIESYNKKYVLEYVDYHFNEPRYDIEHCREEELSYALPLYLRLRLVKKETGEVTEQEVYVGDMPQMTETGSFVINGAERIIVNQLQRSPGVFLEEDTSTSSTGRIVYRARIIPERGNWLDLEMKEDLLYLRINRGRRLLATLFVRALGGEPVEVVPQFENPEDQGIVEGTFAQDGATTQREALLKIYQRLRPGRPPVFESVKEVFGRTFLDARRYSLGAVGRYQLNQELGLNDSHSSMVLQLSDVIGVIKKLLELQRVSPELRSMDHLCFRRIRRIGDLLSDQVHVGLAHMTRIVQQRMSIQDPQTMSPRSLVNTRAIKGAIESFFHTGRLSQYLDQTNPLSELTHKRRLSALGPGGLTRVQAKEEVRDVHYSHYGRICPVETPEGQNIGLITSLATYARVNELGFLETPYRKVSRRQAAKRITYLDARAEDDQKIAGTDAIDADGKFTSDQVIIRYRGDISVAAVDEVDYVDVSPKQIVSVTTSLIPFLEHNEANRALMGSNMQRQGVPLEMPEQPLVQTGMEGKVARDSMGAVIARRAGEVIAVDGGEIQVKTSSGVDRYRPVKFRRSNQRTCINQRPIVKLGQKVQRGDFLSDGSGIREGKLSLGRNVLVAFMPWEGYNYEDAILISERLVKDDVFTSIHIEQFQVEAKELRSGMEEITSDIPNVEESALKNLDESGIVRVGAEIGPGDILVGKVTPQVEVKLTPEERLLRSIFGEKAQKVKDNSLRVPHGIEGKVIRVKVFSREAGDDLPPDVRSRVKVYVGIRRKIGVGDKVSGRHGNKGVVSRILPEEDMPYLADGTPVEMVLNPLGVPSRMNIGQILELHLGWVARTLGVEVVCPVFEGPKPHEIHKLLSDSGLPESGKATLYDGRTGEPFDNEVAVGYMYAMKLIHLAEEKIHARSTGPYALITQQPLGGRSRQGGQRFGEMEVWALEGYGAAYCLQEMLTGKSDDLQGRTRIHEWIITGENLLDTQTPESFKVLVKELQALGLTLEFWKDGHKYSILDMEREESEED